MQLRQHQHFHDLNKSILEQKMSDSEISDSEKKQYDFDEVALDAVDNQRAEVSGGSFMAQFDKDHPHATAGERMQHAQVRAAEKAFKGDNFDTVFERAIIEELKKMGEWNPKNFYVRNGVVDKYKFIFQYRDQTQLIFHKIKDPKSLTQNINLQKLIKKVAKLIRREGANNTQLNGLQTHLVYGVIQSLLAIANHTQMFAEITSRIYKSFPDKLVAQLKKDVPSLPWLQYFKAPEIEKELRGSAEIGKRISHLISCVEPIVLGLFEARTTGDLEATLKKFRNYERMFPVDQKQRDWWREENKASGLKTIRIVKTMDFKDYLFDSETADKLKTFPIITKKDQESNKKKKKRKRSRTPSVSSEDSSSEEDSHRPRRKRRKKTKDSSGGITKKRAKSQRKHRNKSSKNSSRRTNESESESEKPESEKVAPVSKSTPPVSPAPTVSQSSRRGRGGRRQRSSR